MKDIEAQQVPILRISFTSPLTNSAQVGPVLSFETYCERDTGIGYLHSLVDKLSDVARRQVGLYEIEELAKQIENVQIQIDRMVFDMEAMENLYRDKANEWAIKRRGEYKLSEAELKSRSNIETSIRSLQEAKKRLEKSRADKLLAIK